MKNTRKWIFIILCVFFSYAKVYAEPNVVVSIKPIHALVAAVMQGVATPQLIIDGAGSPHSYHLKPSQAKAIQEADIVFWIGPGLENFLTKPIATLGENATSIPLGEAPGLTQLAIRTGVHFDRHDHDEDHNSKTEHDEHESHEHEDDANHDQDEHDEGEEHKEGQAHNHDEANHKHDEDHHHDHGDIDMHIWLDPHNAKVLVRAIAAHLSKIDPENKAIYTANATKTADMLDELTQAISTQLETVRGRPYMVFHDAYQYFEHRFGLSAVGAITLNPESAPSAERVHSIQSKLEETGTLCVFTEPQFSPKVVEVVIEGTSVRTGVLDPLGASLEAGPALYAQVLETMAEGLYNCLSEKN